MFSSNISIQHKKSIIQIRFYCHHQEFFLLKNIFKGTLQYVFNIFILFKEFLILNLTLN